LAVLLLSDISIQPSYTEIYQSPVLDAGLSPINTSITTGYHFNENAQSEFWWYFNTALSDTRNVRTVDPLNCPQGEVCKAYFLPGTPANLVPDLSQPDITTENYTDATSFIQHDAPGYQLDFSPLEPADVPPMYLSDCRLYGTSQSAIEICLKSANTSFIAGTFQCGLLLILAWKACPDFTRVSNSCLNTTDWQLTEPLNTNMTISERRATTVFDRSNLTIIDILDIADPTPTNYTPNDFFVFYDILFSINETEPFYNVTAQYLLLTALVSVLNNNPWGPLGIGNEGSMSELQQLLVLVPLIFNSIYWDFPFSSENLNMGKSVALAIPTYRVSPRLMVLLTVTS